MRLGELLSIAREVRKMSLRELERQSGVPNALISQIETGKIKSPSFLTVVRICNALGVSLERAADTARIDLSMLRKSRTRGE